MYYFLFLIHFSTLAKNVSLISMATVKDMSWQQSETAWCKHHDLFHLDLFAITQGSNCKFKVFSTILDSSNIVLEPLGFSKPQHFCNKLKPFPIINILVRLVNICEG